MRNPSDATVCYPPADRFIEAFGDAQLREWLARRSARGQPLFVRVQLPLCGTPRCHCGSAQYTEYLLKEIGLVAALLGRKPALAPCAGDDAPACHTRTRISALTEQGARTGLLMAMGWDALGCGPGAIGHLGPACYQNERSLERYCAELDAGRLPVARGLELGADDLVRRTVIEALACQQRVSIEAIELSHLVEFSRYFATELAALERFARAGLVELEHDWIVVTPKGSPRLRAICSVFDRYRREHKASRQRSNKEAA